MAHKVYKTEIGKTTYLLVQEEPGGSWTLYEVVVLTSPPSKENLMKPIPVATLSDSQVQSIINNAQTKKLHGPLDDFIIKEALELQGITPPQD